MKEKLLADPNTRKIAETVQMKYEDYVEQVMKYLANPNLEPTLNIIDDAGLKEHGIPVPDMKKAAEFIQEYVDAQEISTKSKFADPNSQREKVSGKIPLEPPATARPEDVRQDLKADLERERHSGKIKKV